jgi:hypothetical protein
VHAKLFHLKKFFESKKDKMDSVPEYMLESIGDALDVLLDTKLSFNAVQTQLGHLQTAHDKLRVDFDSLKTAHNKLEADCNGSHDKLAARQICHSLSKKLLYFIAKRAGMGDCKDVSQKKLSTVGDLNYHAQTKQEWIKFSSAHPHLQLPNKPKLFWEELRTTKAELDTFVHVGSFPHYTYEDLKAIVAPAAFEDEALRLRFIDYVEMAKWMEDNHNIPLYSEVGT